MVTTQNAVASKKKYFPEKYEAPEREYSARSGPGSCQAVRADTGQAARLGFGIVTTATYTKRKLSGRKSPPTNALHYYLCERCE